MRVDAADMRTCAITNGEGGPRCGRASVTTMGAYQPPVTDDDGQVWPELDLSFGVCTEHLETFTGAYLKGEVGLGLVEMGDSRGLTPADG